MSCNSKHTPWNDREDEMLRQLWPTMMKTDIAKTLGRSYDSIMSRAKKLGIQPKLARHTAPKKKVTLTQHTRAVLSALKTGPLAAWEIHDRMRERSTQIDKVLAVMQADGLIETDGESWWLTPQGKAQTPCRNPHFAAKYGYQQEARK